MKRFVTVLIAAILSVLVQGCNTSQLPDTYIPKENQIYLEDITEQAKEYFQSEIETLLDDSNYEGTGTTSENENIQPTPEDIHEDDTGSRLRFHFIDVGQGDATLLACDGEYMLVDAGENNYGTYLQNYLLKAGVKELKYAVVTHGDSDHCGGMDVILSKFPCGSVLMNLEDKNTKTYQEVIDTITYQRIPLIQPQIGETYTLGSATITVLSPEYITEDSNNNSIVLYITHGEKAFLLMGDASEEIEAAILTRMCHELPCDLIKLGHHGSKYSSSYEFLKTTGAIAAVISVGEKNEYYHPHATTLNNLRNLSINVYRTDEQGTILVESDGYRLTFNNPPSISWQAGEGAQ